MLDAIRVATGHDVELKYLPDEPFIAMSRSHGVQESKIRTLVKMFQSYNDHGFKGNPIVTSALLGRSPNDFQIFLKRALQ